MIEGLLFGGIGAGLALFGLWCAYWGMAKWWGPELAGLAFLDRREAAMLVASGLGVGATAGLFASRTAD